MAAIVDRLTFHTHIIQTGTESYRVADDAGKHGADGRRRPDRDHNRLGLPNRIALRRYGATGGHRYAPLALSGGARTPATLSQGQPSGDCHRLHRQ